MQAEHYKKIADECQTQIDELHAKHESMRKEYFALKRAEKASEDSDERIELFKQYWHNRMERVALRVRIKHLVEDRNFNRGMQLHCEERDN